MIQSAAVMSVVEMLDLGLHSGGRFCVRHHPVRDHRSDRGRPGHLTQDGGGCRRTLWFFSIALARAAVCRASLVISGLWSARGCVCQDGGRLSGCVL